MFDLLREPLHFAGSYSDLMAQSLIAHFIPFRSPRLHDLPRRRESVNFGCQLWMKLLPHAAPKLIICLCRAVQEQLRDLIPAALSATYINTESYGTGWGKYAADIDTFTTERGHMRLLYLPHLQVVGLHGEVGNEHREASVTRQIGSVHSDPEP